MTQDNTIQRAHEFFVDDGLLGSEYTKGNTVAGSEVFGTLREIQDKFSELFFRLPTGLQIITPKSSFLHEDCHIFIGAQQEKDGPSSGFFLGKVILTGVEENIQRIEDILEREFPKIIKK